MKKNRSFTLVYYALFGMALLFSSVGLGIYAGHLQKDFIPSSADTSATNVTDTAEHSDHGTSNSADTAQDLGLLMIDPGHGGEDGGAVSDSGVLEKDLNLAVSDDVAHLCLMFGIPYSTTRNDDRMLYDYYSEYTDYTGKKKSLDLKNRLRLTNESGSALLLSVHMNKFTDSRPSGLQMYYSVNSADSEAIAGSIQNFASSHIQKDNDRQAKEATSSIYLLYNIDIPAVLAECGFLSNPEETGRLTTPTYRSSLAVSLFIPCAEYLVRCGT